MTLAIVALVLFALAAVAGLVMAVGRFGGQPAPRMPLALAHGALAAAGLVVYLVALLTADDPPTFGIVALVLFVAAALGGFALFLGFHRPRRPLPIPLMVVHAAVAIGAFVLLIIAVATGTDAG